jgi:protein disulfide-isomerase A1
MVRSLQGVSTLFGPSKLFTNIHSLAPNYEKLAELYTKNSDYNSKVTIAKVDATLNDVPDEISGFPTIKLYPAGDKKNPVEYSGSRTIEDLANFVKENGKYKIDAYVSEDEDTGMADASSAASDMPKAAPAATVSETAEGVAEKVKSVVGEAAEAAQTLLADTDDGGAQEHDEL